MGRFLTSPRVPWVLSVFLLSLLVLLAGLQYRWTGELSRAERDGKASSLRRHLDLMTRDFDRQLMLLALSLLLEGEVGAGPSSALEAAPLEDRLADGWRTWRRRSGPHELIQSLYIAPLPAFNHASEPVDPGDALRWLQRPDGPWQSVPWPPRLMDLASSATQGAGWQRPGRRGRPQGRPPQLLDPEVPALLLPLWDSRLWDGRNVPPSRRPAPPRQSLIVVLDRPAIDALLADLAQQYLGRSGHQLDFNLRLVDEDDRLLWSFGPEAQPPGSVVKAGVDGESNLFRLRPIEELTSGEGDPLASLLRAPNRPGNRPPPEAFAGGPTGPDESPTEADGFEPQHHFPRLRALLSFMASPREGAWRLQATHTAGSLDAAVRAARRRNLWLSGGVLGLLAISLVLLLLSTRRAQQLAQQQMEFVAGVTHELMTPLAALRSAGENLADGVVTDPQHVVRYGKLVDREGRRLSTMVAQILELSGMQAGHPNLTLAPVRIGEVIRRALADCEHDLQGAGFVVERHDAEVPEVLADGDALQRALVNLIQNAVKYAADGAWLQITSRSRQRWLEIEVDDRGPGIDGADLPHLFAPFRRGRRMAASSVAGSGLGLSLVKSTIEAHGGEVTAQNRRGADGRIAGARLTIRLPLNPHTASDFGR